MAEALLLPLCPAGFWVFDDPDDSREVEGLIRTELGIPTDEISFQSFDPNQVKKFLDPDMPAGFISLAIRWLFAQFFVEGLQGYI